MKAQLKIKSDEVLTGWKLEVTFINGYNRETAVIKKNCLLCF